MDIEHVYPVEEREHLTEGLTCWCRPKYVTPCDECDGDSCWNCGGTGVLHVDDPETHDGPFGVMVIHYAE
jgi:hypothetical protein